MQRARRVWGPWVLTLLLGVIAAAGWPEALAHVPRHAPHPWPWVATVALFVVGRFLRVELHATRTATISFVMADLAFVVALLLGQLWTIPAGLAAGAVIAALFQRPPLVKFLFNIAQESVGALAGTVVFDLLGDTRQFSGRSGFAAMAGGLVMAMFCQLAVSGVTRLASGTAQSPLRALWTGTVCSIANSSVAVEAVFLGSIAVPLALVPAAFVIVLFAVYSTLRRQQRVTDRSELLYRATAALHEQPNLDDGLLSVLGELRGALRAEWARLVLLTPEGAVTCAVGERIEDGTAMTAAAPTEESAARRLAAEVDDVTLYRAGSVEVTSGAVSVFAHGDTVVAPVRRNDERAGVVVVDARAGSADRLSKSDIGMVEMMTKQIGMALERGDLERSIHQLVELERQLRQQAFYDSVTGLANRNHLMTELADLCRTQNGQHAVLLVDLDDFKTVNDSLGHVAGDELLKTVAQRLVGCIGAGGLVARLGGDEFAIILRDADDLSCERTAQRIIGALSQVTHLEGREVGIGASVGLRRTGGVPDQPADVLRDADLALYNAKSQGKGRFARFEPVMHAQAQERLELTSALATAIDRGEFVLAYQPIVELGSGRVAAAEALVRWRHPERGELSPGAFLRLTEESGWIVELGWYVLRQALQQLAAWEPVIAGTDFYLSVNVSTRQLKEPHFAEDVLALLRAYGVPGERLVLEITESLFIDDPRPTKVVLETMAGAGVRFGLDDFGTGYSSLSQLQELPLALVKIDRAFVARLGLGAESRLLVRGIIQLADALHLHVVAEGVETAEQRDALVEMHCRRAQGYLFGRPASPEQLIESFAGDLPPTAAAVTVLRSEASA